MKQYTLYVDESGDHTYRDLDDPSRRYLGLIGVAVERDSYRSSFHPLLEKLKQEHFPHDPDEPVILHRTDILHKKGSFWRLRDPENEQRFNEAFLNFLCHQEYLIMTVVIDKLTHKSRYGDAAYHPYHFCLTAMMERYCGYLNFVGGQGSILAESRGKEENTTLAAAYEGIYREGTRFRSARFFSGVLTKRDLGLKQKTANIAGLQIADLLAYPCKENVLVAHNRITRDSGSFGAQICKAVANKRDCRYLDSRVEGYGEVFIG